MQSFRGSRLGRAILLVSAFSVQIDRGSSLAVLVGDTKMRHATC
jgi:hypothetical protein